MCRSGKLAGTGVSHAQTDGTMTVQGGHTGSAATLQTLQADAAFQGVGLHGGQCASMRVLPAPPAHGIIFRRTDLPEGRGDIAARWDQVVDTRLCTRLGNAHGASVGTVEHLMAALAGCGIIDALILIDGPEVPIMDGSSAPFVEGLLGAGVVDSGQPVPAVRILAPVTIEDGCKRASLSPADRFEVSFSIDFADPAIGAGRGELGMTGSVFADELADCRTFGHLCEVEALRARGLGRGGSLQNAIVVDRGSILNPEGLRRPDEFVRHKMLDAVGDLALAGAPILGRFASDRGGHELTNRLLRALFARPDAWRWDTLQPGQWFGGVTCAPASACPAEAIAV